MLGVDLHEYTADDIEQLSNSLDVHPDWVKMLIGRGIRYDEMSKVKDAIMPSLIGHMSIKKLFTRRGYGGFHLQHAVDLIIALVRNM